MKQGHDSSILVIDDDTSVLETTAVLLREHGYSVISCENAKDAMAKLRENKVDVVLTDIRMPEVSGIELLEEVHSINMNIPVILMTAYADVDVAISAMGKGAFDFIVKPYKSELLVYSVAMAVKHKKLIK